MDIVTVSTRNYSKKKENKENAQPTLGSKTSVKREKHSAPPFQLKSNKKEETLAKSGPLKAKEKQTDTRTVSGEALKKTVQRNVRGATVTEVKQRQTHSQAFLSEQAVRHKKMVTEAPKPPAAVTSSKPAPGTYKGRVVQSKIGSIWRSSAAVGAADPKPSAPKTEIQRVGNVTKIRSKSAVDAQRNGTHKPAPIRSVSEKPAQVSKRPVTSRPPAGFRSARPPVRTVPATLTSTSTRNTKVAPIKASGGLNSKLKVSVTDRKVNKPPVSSTISQYRLNMESAEERRAKLATWQASKGKTFKRPAMTAAVQPKTKVSAKPNCVCGPKPQCQSLVKTRPAQASSIDPEPGLEAQNTWRAEVASHSQTPAVMNTTLDLLENSDVFYGQQDGVDDVVVNLCDALEALATPSGCSDEVSQMTDVCREVKVENGNEDKDCEGEEELKDEGPEDVSEQLKDEVEVDDVEEVESDEGVMETTPHKEDASVVKYSVKTTPYLQSVKKTIEGEVSMSTSKRKSYIKDLKFLTPVRRSCRIERKSSHLPTMLLDHDPCVSSLAGLVQLDDDPNAYIFRKNPALLEELPDQPRM